MSAFSKELLRTITRKPGRFLALLAIVALGAGFYAGLRMTSPDMKAALDEYLDVTRTYDVRVVSTWGLTDDDLAALGDLPGATIVQGAFQTDVVAHMNGSAYTMRVHSLPKEGGYAQDGSWEPDDAVMNVPVLMSGRWPAAKGECVICGSRVMDSPPHLGDTIEFVSASTDVRDYFVTSTYTVVGMVNTPYYVSSASLGTSALGAGIVQQYLYIPETDFRRTVPYTEAFVEVEGARALTYGTQEYDEAVEAFEDRVREIAPERSRIRKENMGDMASLRFYDDITTYAGVLDLLDFALSHPFSQTSDVEDPEWLVMGRDKNVGIVSFTSDADRVDNIAQAFPLIFFLVAALVALTTMTRMVDEERMLIGTYKALGYSKARVTSKYIIYMLLAGGFGSFAGISVLGRLLPAVIMNAYAIIYYVPSGDFGVLAHIAALSAGAVLALTLGATWFAAATTLSERPAALLLPRVQANGKRILLERFTAIWSRMSFTWKVTWRNIFRYKKRFVMTVIGIAGCTGLLLTGLGLHDSINDIIDVQYGELVKHNAVVAEKSSVSPEERSAIEAVFSDRTLVEAETSAQGKTMMASGPRASGKRVDVIVPEEPNAFTELTVLRDRQTHTLLEIPDGQVLINEKLAKETGINPGDEISFYEQDVMGNATNTFYTFTVAALTENYIYNYAYMTADTWEAATGENPRYSSRYAQVNDENEGRQRFEDALRETQGVKTVSFNDETIDTYRTMLKSVDLIVVVLIVSAAALAFIVLYNLTNINIEERLREIATLKVLGFTRRETNAYIFREIALLALVGCLAGLVFGIWLEGFVVTTAEVDQVMFGRTIHPASFCAAFVLTMVFSAIAMAFMTPKLAHIDMVESLKSNE